MQLLIKRFILLVTIITLGLLCACTKNDSLVPDSSSTINTINATPTTSASIPTLDDIMNIVKSKNNMMDIKIINTIPVGTNYLLVEYYLMAYNEFLLYNKQTGEYDRLSRDAKLIKAENENHLIFEVIGDWDEGGFMHFPFIEEYIRKADNESGRDGFYCATHSEYFALDRSVKGGSHDGDMLSVIIPTFDGLEALFKPASADSAFYAAASYIPPTTTYYDKDTHQLTIELDKCQLDNDVKTDVEVKTNDNAYISVYKVIQKDDIVYITITLRATAAGYMMGVGKVPGEENFDGYPYLLVKFTNTDNMAATSTILGIN